jgi:TolB-like protein/DNA-binding winged helix-turn-helix (wHTH) protein/Tfp pilus assembly protein PilF
MSNATQPAPRFIRFAAFTVDLQLGELRKFDTKIRLQQQPFQVLAMLLEHPGELVTREELRQRLWPNDSFGDFDHGLNAAINRLRERLNDDAEKPRYVETIPRRGYRFISPIETVEPLPATVAEAATSSSATVPHRRSLRWLVAAASIAFLAVALLLVMTRWPSKRDTQSSASPSIRSIAVLPLANLSNDPEQEYFADGMTDELISNLAQISALRVISRTSAMKYKKTTRSVPEIGKALNVDAVVEGSVERSGGRVRVSAQLIRTSTDTHLWAKSYERDLGDVIALQDELAKAIADEIRIQLLPAERARLTTTRAIRPDAYEAYLRGLYHLSKRTQTDLEKSTGYFERAVELDPEYALAYAGLADSYALRGSLLYMVLAPRDVMPKSKAAAMRALQIDANLGEAYAPLAYVETLYDWSWAKSEEDFQRAIALKPNYAEAHLWYAMHLAARGRHKESIAEVKRAQELDPLSLIVNNTVGLMFYFAGDYDNAIAQFGKVLELDSDFFVAHWALGVTYEQKGMYKEARVELQKALALSPKNVSILESLGEVDALSGRTREARQILQHLAGLSKQEFVPPYLLAALNLALGDKEQTFVWLEKAYNGRDNNLIFLNVDPCLRTIRGDTRFQELVRRMGL